MKLHLHKWCDALIYSIRIVWKVCKLVTCKLKMDHHSELTYKANRKVDDTSHKPANKLFNVVVFYLLFSNYEQNHIMV